MTRLIRWAHIAGKAHLSVLWWDHLVERTQRTIVEVDSDVDGTALAHVRGEPLPWDLSLEVVHDLHCAEDDTGFAPRPQFYQGVLVAPCS